MHVIVRVLLVDGLHGRVEFVANFVAVLMLAKSVSTSCGTLMVMPYMAICAAFDCKSSMLMLIFLQKSKGVIDHLKKLFQHIICRRTVFPINGHLHYVE